MPATVGALPVAAARPRAADSTRRSPAMWILGASIVGSLPFVALSLANAGGSRVVWDNIHWSVSAIGAAIAIGWSIRGSTGRIRAVRFCGAAAFGLWALATVAWAWMNLIGTPSVPSITDVFIVSIIVPGTGLLVATVHGRLTIAEEAAVYLDALLGFLLIGSLLIFVFGPTALLVPTAASVAAIAYPTLFIGLGGSGLIAILAIGYPVSRRGSFPLLGGCVLIGCAYLGWLSATLNLSDPGEGSSILFTAGTLISAYGVVTWNEERSTSLRFLSAARGATRIIAPTVASLLFLLMLASGPESIEGILRVGIFAASIAFLIRQALLLRERTRTLAAVTALTEENARLVRELRNELERRAKDERRMIQASRAAAVGELAAGVAHEVNNPLTGVLGFAELLLTDLGPDDPHRADLETIRTEAIRARDIVRALRDFASPREPELTPTDITALVRQTIDLVRYSLERRGISIQEDLDLLPAIRIDGSAIQQAVLNILNNARQAVADGGHLEVSVRADGDGCLISITDDGVGMDAATAGLAFDPFFSGREEGSDLEPSAGLGLSVSHGLIESHGGTIRIRSTPGRGTTVEIRLPADNTSGSIDQGQGGRVA
jgi:signal transduction histidine kinase